MKITAITKVISCLIAGGLNIPSLLYVAATLNQITIIWFKMGWENRPFYYQSPGGFEVAVWYMIFCSLVFTALYVIHKESYFRNLIGINALLILILFAQHWTGVTAVR